MTTLTSSHVLVALVAWGVLAFGAVYPWAYWPLLAGAASLGGWWTVRERAWRDDRVWRLGGGVALVALFGLVQVVPWPARLLAWVSPASEAFFQTWQVGYLPGAHATFSIAPGATLVGVAEVVALGLLFVGAARALPTISLGWLVRQLTTLGVAVSVFGILQAMVIDDHAPRVYGVWQTEEGGSPFGPFINRNHFAGFIVMLVPVTLGYAWALVERSRSAGRVALSARWAGGADGARVTSLLVGALIMTVAVVVTGSRSGLVSLAVALALWFVLLAPRLSRRARLAGGLMLALTFVVAIAWAGAGALVSRFERSTADFQGRWSAWSDTVTIISDFRWVGTGLGGYDRAMLVYQTAGRPQHFAEAHNDYLQWVAETGLFGTGLALVVVIGFVATVRARLPQAEGASATWVRRGAVAGMAGMAAQSVVEFSLQMPANAVLFVFLAAVAVHRPAGGSRASRR